MSTKLKILSLSVVVSLLLWGPLNATTAETSNDPILEVTEPDALQIWLERLAYAESNGREDIVILDVNNRYSYSCLQFQKATWEEQTKLYGMEADIMDCAAQKELARRMLAANPQNWRHWSYSARHKIGLPPT